MDHEEMKQQLKPVVEYVQQKTGYLIFLKGKQDGKLLTGTINRGDGIVFKVAYVYFKNLTEALHELSHIWVTPEPRPKSDLALLLRELKVWRCSECLHRKFDLPFDVKIFDEGISSYIVALLMGPECPPYEFLSQLIGE